MSVRDVSLQNVLGSTQRPLHPALNKKHTGYGEYIWCKTFTNSEIIKFLSAQRNWKIFLFMRLPNIGNIMQLNN